MEGSTRCGATAAKRAQRAPRADVLVHGYWCAWRRSDRSRWSSARRGTAEAAFDATPAANSIYLDQCGYGELAVQPTSSQRPAQRRRADRGLDHGAAGNRRDGQRDSGWRQRVDRDRKRCLQRLQQLDLHHARHGGRVGSAHRRLGRRLELGEPWTRHVLLAGELRRRSQQQSNLQRLRLRGPHRAGADGTTTIQSGGGVMGASIPVLKGSAVTDTAHIAGAEAASATGP